MSIEDQIQPILPQVSRHNYSTEGISLELLNLLIETEFGGRTSLHDMEIRHVSDKYVKEKRHLVPGSFIDYLKTKPEYLFGISEASVFVSYNLGCRFVDFVDSLNRCFANDDGIVLFIPFFSNNLASLFVEPGKLPKPETMISHVVGSCARFQSTVLVLRPWDDPSRPRARLWCLLELYIAAKSDQKLRIAACWKKDKLLSNKFDADIDLLSQFLDTIDVEISQIFTPEYREAIMSLVVSLGGVLNFNTTVKSFLATCRSELVDLIEQKLAGRAQLPFFVLDLDNTLFSASVGMASQVHQLNLAFIREKASLTSSDTLEKWMAYYDKYSVMRATHDPDSMDEMLTPRGFMSDHTVMAKVTADDYYDYLDRRLDYEALHDVLLRERLHQLFDDMNANIVLFSNSNFKHVSRCLQILGLEDHFDFMVYADFSDTSVPVKPDVEAFKRLERIIGIDKSAHTIYFVDDSMANVHIAEDLSWIAAHINEGLVSEAHTATRCLPSELDTSTTSPSHAHRKPSCAIRSILDIRYLPTFAPLFAKHDAGSEAGSEGAAGEDETQPHGRDDPQATPLKLCLTYEGTHVSAPCHAPADITYFEEDPDFYKFIMEPYYATQSLPNVLYRDMLGGSKFYNRCARRGLVKIFMTEDSHGAILVMPNPGYHDPWTMALKNKIRGKVSEAELDKIRADL